MGNKRTELESIISDYFASLNPEKLGLKEKGKPKITEGIEGDANINYIIGLGENQFFFRLNKSRSDSFEKEFRKLKALEQYDVAPKAYIHGKEPFPAPFMVAELIPGYPLGKEEIDQNMPEIIKALNQVYEVPTDDLLRKEPFRTDFQTCRDYALDHLHLVEGQIKDHISNFGESQLSDAFTEMMHAFRARVEGNPEAYKEKALGLIHKNLRSRSMIKTPGGIIRFVNWENAEVGDRSVEINNLSKLCNFSPESNDLLTAHYKGINEDEFSGERSLFHLDLQTLSEALHYASGFRKAQESGLKEGIEHHGQALSNTLATMLFVSDAMQESRNAKKMIEEGRLSTLLKPRPRKVSPVYDSEDQVKEPGVLEKLGKFLTPKNLALGVALFTSYSGLYNFCRKPVVVETKQLAGATVEIVDQRARWLPGFHTIDDLLWKQPKTESRKYEDGSLGGTINRILFRREAENLYRKLDEISENNSLLNKKSSEKSWDSYYQAVGDIMKGIDKGEFVEKFSSFAEEAAERHEERHLLDKITSYNPVHSEIRAILHSIFSSSKPTEFVRLEGSLHPFAMKKVDPAYQKAAYLVMFKGYMSYPDTPSRKEVHKLSPEEKQKRAKEIFNAWYPKDKIN